MALDMIGFGVPAIFLALDKCARRLVARKSGINSQEPGSEIMALVSLAIFKGLVDHHLLESVYLTISIYPL